MQTNGDHRLKSVACLIAGLLLLVPKQGLSQAAAAAPADSSAPPATEVAPKGSPPSEEPPAPPAKPPAPPSSGGQAAKPTTAEPSGQWVYTNQYGWIWAPYGDEYVYTPADEGGDPYEYLYSPGRGWVWLAAPWVWGVGPLPYFGVRGAWGFHWYRGPAYHFRAAGRPLFRGSYGHGGGHFGGHGGGHRG